MPGPPHSTNTYTCGVTITPIVCGGNKLYLNALISSCIRTRFWNSDRTIQSDRENLELLIFAVLLISRTALWEKRRDPCKPRSNFMVLKTMNGSHGSFIFFSKYRLKLKIWLACTLDFFQIWDQKICVRKRKQTKKKMMTK